MTISRRSDYAVRALVYMATQGNEGFHRIEEVARSQAIPKPFLAKIVQQLVTAGLLETRRGKGGGVYVPTDIGAITVLDVVQAIDGPIALNWCTTDPNRCDRWQGCSVHPVWAKAQQLLAEALGQARIADLAQEQRCIDATVAAEQEKRAGAKRTST